MMVFPASLGLRERLITYGVGYGVGFGVPLMLGIGFAIGFGQPLLLLFPLPFMIAFGLPWFFRLTGFGITGDRLVILRPVRSLEIPLESLREVVHPATVPAGAGIGIARVQGIHGTFGTFWNREWGRYRAYVTDHRKLVELRLDDDTRVIVSPDDPAGFVAALREAKEAA